LGYSGIGLLLRGYQRVRTRGLRSVAWEQVEDFGEWVEAAWNDARQDYRFAALRDRQNLRALYPPTNTKFIRLRVREGSRDVGWAVCLNTQMDRHKYFPNMRLGSIIDCFARGEEAWKIIGAATRHLESSGADLIVSNQSHRSWCAAMHETGYFTGPTNFLLAVSTKLGARLSHANEQEFHLTRGDGDGPIHL
jgi:hypothetical protein